MNAEHVNIFISALAGVFQEIAQTNLSINSKRVRSNNKYDKNVVVLVGVTGEVRGNIALSMDESYAKAIASNMMYGMPVEVFDEMPQSAIREVANMMMGKVASLFEEVGIMIDITPPTLMTGEALTISSTISPTLVLGFNDANNPNQNVIELDITLK